MLFFTTYCGKSPQKNQPSTQEKITILLPRLQPGFTLAPQALLLSQPVEPLPTNLVDTLLLDDARLRRESADYAEVARVASREIAATHAEIEALREGLDKTSDKLALLRRQRSAEINQLWSRAVAPLDARFAERARRFQVMLATRVRDRGGHWPEDSPLLEPAAARDLFERLSRPSLTWAEDSRWLETQWSAWQVYEEVWREARARIRQECEKLRTETSDHLATAEETLSQNEEKINQLELRAAELQRPLWEAQAAIHEILARRTRELVYCLPEIYAALAESAIASFDTSETTHQIAAKYLTKNSFLLLLLEDEVGYPMLFCTPLDAVLQNAQHGDAHPRLLRPVDLLPK